MSSQIHTQPQLRHRAYSATAQPPPYSLTPFCPPPPPAADSRPRKHSAPSRARASTSASKASRSAPTTPPAYDEPSSSSRLRHRAASAEFGNNLFLTPAHRTGPPNSKPIPRFGSRSATQLSTLHAEPVALVQPQVHALYRPPSYGSYFFDLPGSEDDDEGDDSLIYPTFGKTTAAVPAPPTVAASAVASMSKTAESLRARLFGAHTHPGKGPKSISTTPGLLGAGETETEADEPPIHLPTARIIASSDPLVPPHALLHLLFELSRFLSIVPAVIGCLYNVYHIFSPPAGSGPAAGIDYFVSALWAILTGYQCLRLATGLLARWKHYYPPLPTLIRLLGLQAICWPMTHATLQVLGHARRPLVCWAVIGTFTYWRRWSGGRWGGRRWDWAEVGVQCMLPAGMVYFVMAWAEVLRRELERGC
ncbi:hypothetical protein FIBSPDRAFT_857798 [Athelia psychrophila]|uniref:Uncharacterized protein n=1 Tax=Athelia psychrophila TaxID=1759441 RepID=A0A166MHH5_9AGAM|nr:hypothetical protein FIBSPDRAFT_857798 [Fibularhizoctonia sp. CBS 109695]